MDLSLATPLRRVVVIHESRWRLFTSADTEKAARAAGRSVLAAVIPARAVDLAVARYFKGGFKVDFTLRHPGNWGHAAREVESAFERACLDSVKVIDAEHELELWSGTLNVPRAEALGVVLTHANAGAARAPDDEAEPVAHADPRFGRSTDAPHDAGAQAASRAAPDDVDSEREADAEPEADAPRG